LTRPEGFQPETIRVSVGTHQQAHVLLTAARRRFRRKEWFESGNELGQILGDDLPNDIFVDAKGSRARPCDACR
jgi:hypothetical protein